ncbi:Bgt-3153, partial [Blumeria graminis f. sp. tritici]
VLRRFDTPFVFSPPPFDRTRLQHANIFNSLYGSSRSLYLLLSIYDTLLFSHRRLAFSV